MPTAPSNGAEAADAPSQSGQFLSLSGEACAEKSSNPKRSSEKLDASSGRGGDTLFVGGVSATIVGYDAQESALLAQLGAKGMTISLSISVTPTSDNMIEIFGPELSSPHPSSLADQHSAPHIGLHTNLEDYTSLCTLRCSDMAKEPRSIGGVMGSRRAAFVPVLLKTAAPLEMSTEEWREYAEKEDYTVASTDTYSSALDGASTTSTVISNSNTDGPKGSSCSAKVGQKVKETGYLSLSSTLNLHLHPPSPAKRRKDDASRDERPSTSSSILLATTNVCIPSVAYHVKKDLCSIVRIIVPASSLTSPHIHADNEGHPTSERKKSIVSGATSSSANSNTPSGPVNHTHSGDKIGQINKMAGTVDGISFSVALRVISVGHTIGAMVEADGELRKLLGSLSSDLPYTLSPPSSCYRFLSRDITPYGAIPLPTLFKLYRLFCEHSYYASSSFSSTRHRHMGQDQAFWCGTPEWLNAEATFPHRWNMVTDCGKEYLAKNIMGDLYATPLLLTLSHCPNLRHLSLASNRLGDVTCARIGALFSHHRYLSHVHLQGNNIYESGAEALLRLVRRNRRIVMLDLTKNPCEGTWIQRRIEKLVADHACAFRDDPLNVFSPTYNYLISPTSLTPSIIQEALVCWAHLTVTPIGDIDVWPRNSTTEDMDQYVDESVLPRLREGYRMSEAPHSIIPLVARAPLLSELIRTVYRAMESVVPDTIVRALFMDVAQMEKGGVTMTTTTASSSSSSAGGQAADGGDGAKEDEGEARNHSSPAPTPTTKKKTSSGKEGDDDKGKGSKKQGGSRGQSTSSPSSPCCASKSVRSVPTEVWSALQLDEASKQVGPCIRADELYSISFLRIIVTAFRAIEHHFEWDDVAMMLQKVGQRQVHLGVRLEDYWLAIHVFMRALEISLEGSSAGEALSSIHEDSSLSHDSIFSFLQVVALALRAALISDDVGITA